MLKDSLVILKKIIDAGFDAYIVGGYPRDKYIGRDSTDVDMCTNARPKDLKLIFKGSMLPKEEYGSVTILYKKIRFDITTYRKDIKYENNRLPIEIKYIDNLEEDLKRRDFLMNTLCIDKEGNYVDLLNAKHDIDNHLITTVGNADDKLKEDSLRILRAIRFATILDFQLDEELKQSIINNGHLLKNLSYYRKKEELDKIFSSINSSYGIKMLLDFNLQKYLEIDELSNIKVTSNSLGIWAQLDVLDKYTFSNVEKESIRMINLLKKKKSFDNFDLYTYGLYNISIVAEINNLNKKEIIQRYMNLPIKNKRQIKIDGNDICKILKIKPSKEIKIILNDIEKKIISNDLENNKEKLITYIINNYS